MIIAVPTQDEQIDRHFGHASLFTLYTITGCDIVAKNKLHAKESGHSALSGLLAANGVHLVICGGMGDGARQALNAAHINVVAGAKGDIDQAVLAFLSGELMDTGEGGCAGHSCGAHACGGSCHQN